MQIGMIFTGGTIGSRLQADGYLSLREQGSYALLQGAEERGLLKDVTVHPSEPFQMLSEQMTGEPLAALVRHVRHRLQTEVCDGFLLLHGSDTLAYTAAMLGYALGMDTPPVVLVASNDPLTNPDANGWTNLEYAIRFLREQQGNGVFVSNCNLDGIPTIHYATRLLQQQPCGSDIHSVCDAIYGYYDTKGGFHRCEMATQTAPLLPMNAPFQLLHPAPLMRVEAAVGNGYGTIPEETKAIFCQCYHSGTFCADNCFTAFAAQAAERGIPLYLTGCRSDTADYETVKETETLSLMPLHDIAPIAAYCKAWIAVSNGLPLDCMQRTAAADCVQMNP